MFAKRWFYFGGTFAHCDECCHSQVLNAGEAQLVVIRLVLSSVQKTVKLNRKAPKIKIKDLLETTSSLQ